MRRLLNCNNCSDDYDESTEHLENDTLDLAGDVQSDEEDESGESDEEAFRELLFCPKAQYEVEVGTKFTTDTCKSDIVVHMEVDH